MGELASAAAAFEMSLLKPMLRASSWRRGLLTAIDEVAKILHALVAREGMLFVEALDLGSEFLRSSLLSLIRSSDGTPSRSG